MVTNCCSQLFYEGGLKADLTAPVSDHIQRSLDLPSTSPLQVVSHTFQHVQSGSSLSNESEARLTVRIAERVASLLPLCSIMILTYNKAQVALVNSYHADQTFFVNTIDAR